MVNHTIYMQEYRSGHNEAVLKTVRPKATGVRIPLPAPKKRTTEPIKLGCFFFSLALVREDLNPPLRLFESQNGVRIPHPKIEELALQTQGVGIFVKDEYPSSKPAIQIGIYLSGSINTALHGEPSAPAKFSGAAFKK